MSTAPDRAAAEHHRQEAENLAAGKKIKEASEALARAIASDPEALPLYLRRGELLESLGRPEGARGIYNAGLKKADRSAPLRAELTWRLALVEVLQLENPGRGMNLLGNLPEGALRDDLEGVLALTGGNIPGAVALFNAALEKNPSQEVVGAVFYHASLAYHRLGDTRNAFGSLYHAVNNAKHLGTMRGIETHWELLNATKPTREPSRR